MADASGAEDERAVPHLMSSELRRRGFTVLEARQGGETLAIWRQYGGHSYLLIAEVVMPTMPSRRAPLPRASTTC
jgi:CheY-like chemotaxis protein